MRVSRKFASGAAFAAAIVGLGLAPRASMAGTIVVSPTNMGDWAFANADGNATTGANVTGSGQMVTGPATPPLGVGSANLATGNGTTGGDGSENLTSTQFTGVALADITALSYSTYSTANNGQQWPYMSIEVTYDNGTKFDQLFFEPTYSPNQGTPALNTWQTWNAFSGGFWDNDGVAGCGTPSNAGVATLSSCITALGDATIVNTRGNGELAGLGGVQFRVGAASADEIFNGYVDDFTIGISGTDTTFDFEPFAAATPLPAALPLFAGGLGLLGFLGARKKRKAAAAAA